MESLGAPEWKLTKSNAKEHGTLLGVGVITKNTCKNLQGVRSYANIIYFLCIFMFETQNS